MPDGADGVRFSWFIPIDGDGSRAGTMRAERPPDFEYLRRVAETAEEYGYYSLLIPTRFANGLFGEDAPLAETWTTATALGGGDQPHPVPDCRPARLHRAGAVRSDGRRATPDLQGAGGHQHRPRRHPERLRGAWARKAPTRRGTSGPRSSSPPAASCGHSRARWTSTVNTTGCATPTVRRTLGSRGRASTWAGRRHGRWGCRGGRPTSICPGLSRWRTPPAAT